MTDQRTTTRILPNLILGPHPWEAEPPIGGEFPEFSFIVSVLGSGHGEKFPKPFDDKPRGFVKIEDQPGPKTSGLTLPRLGQIVRDLDRILEDGNTVYIHCMAGVSRSPTIVIAYLMYKKGWSFRKALDFVGDRRGCISPNVYFQRLLKEFEKAIK